MSSADLTLSNRCQIRVIGGKETKTKLIKQENLRRSSAQFIRFSKNDAGLVYDKGQMLLHLVVSSPTVNSDGFFRTVLEQNPAAVSVGDMYGQLPLHLAALYVGGLEVVSVLLEAHKAASSVSTKDGLLPIHMSTGIKGSRNKDLG